MATRTREPAELWEPLHIRYVAIAFGWSWVFWIGGWLLARAMDTGDVCSCGYYRGYGSTRNHKGELHGDHDPAMA